MKGRATAAAVLTALWRMSRPEQVLLITVVFGVGVAAAAAIHGQPTWSGVLWALATLVPTAVSVHVVNEYADHASDALTRRTAFSGGSGALGDLGVDRRVALRGAVGSAVAALAVTTAGLVTGGLPVVAAVLAVLGLVGGWQYSLAPLQLSRRGLGEVGNAILGGLVLPVFGVAAATGRVEAVDVLLFVPFALLDFVNLLETQWPDRVADRVTGKHTLVSRVSAHTVRGLALWATLLGYGLAVTLAVYLMLTPLAVAALLPLPLSLWALVRLTRVERPLPGVLAMTAHILAQGVAWTAVAAA